MLVFSVSTMFNGHDFLYGFVSQLHDYLIYVTGLFSSMRHKVLHFNHHFTWLQTNVRFQGNIIVSLYLYSVCVFDI